MKNYESLSHTRYDYYCLTRSNLCESPRQSRGLPVIITEGGCRSSRAGSRRALKVEMRARTNDEIMQAWCR